MSRNHARRSSEGANTKPDRRDRSPIGEHREHARAKSELCRERSMSGVELAQSGGVSRLRAPNMSTPRRTSFGRDVVPWRSFVARVLAADLLRRPPVVITGHLAFAAIASFFAIWLRFDGEIPAALMAAYLQTLPWILAVRLVTFFPFGLYQGLWRYTSIWDLSRIVLAVLSSSVVIYLFLYRPFGPAVYPRSIPVIESLLLISFLGGIRLLWRVLPETIRVREGRRVLIIGAGDAGEMIVREMRKSSGYEPVGFVDHDSRKIGRTIHGVTVLGTPDDLPRVLAVTKPSEVLLAIPSAAPRVVRGLVRHLEPFKLHITTLPSLRELVHGTVGITQIRPLAIEDLLPRSPVTLSIEPVRELIAGKCVLVTGAGGSIGSELCRQIALLAPANLVLLERYENNLYAIANDLIDRNNALPIHPVIGDVTDAGRMNATFAEYRPDIVFHAAAHKHVPLMEANPCEAVKNNVIGTRTIADVAERYGTERVVLISTDKAVNPSSVMGATKRVAELLVRAARAENRATRFVIVRFGNVLGSNGSVIPRMMDQIRAGGPVTVTHPDVCRFFMLIPEAAQLVLQAAVLAQTHDTLVLDMGEQIKVLDIARNLIRLSGYIPEEEIPITFTGLRPGEKLTEELEADDETLEFTDISKIFRVASTGGIDAVWLMQRINELTRAALHNRTDDVLRCLQEIVPTFSSAAPVGTPASASVLVRPGRKAPAAAPVVHVPTLSSATRAV